MSIDWPVATLELLIGAIGLAAGLAIGYAGHRFALRRLVEEHKNKLALLELQLSAREQHRKEDREDLERSQRVEALTVGRNDPDALKRILEMQSLMTIDESTFHQDVLQRMRGERERRISRTSILFALFVLVTLVTATAAILLVPDLLFDVPIHPEKP